MTAPSVLILGGVSGVARALVAYLVPDEGQALVTAIRIVDKFSIEPATTYIDAAFRRCLESNLVEYKQTNLGLKSQLPEVFARAEGWDIVVDLTGETRYDRPELIHIQQTHQMALQLAQFAAALEHPPKAYVRLTMPYYEMKSGSGHKEGDKLVPDSARGRWWHEALRALGAVENLNVVVIRIAAEYGPGTLGGTVVPRVVVGHVYKYLDEDMKFLYNSDLRVHTVHTADVAQAIFLAGQWAAKLGKAQAIAAAGEEIHWGMDKSDAWKNVAGVIPEKQRVVVPLFNIVDDNDSTQDKLAKAVADVWKIKYGFHNSANASLIAHFAKTDFAEMVEDVNEKHVEAWSKMLAASQPPILMSPISPFLDDHAFRKMAICLDGAKARRVLGFKPAFPKVEAAELRRIVDELQEDQLWPRV